jgi:hypothetical protein
MEMRRLVDLYRERSAARSPRIAAFYRGEVPFLVVQRPSYHLWAECNSLEGVWENNLRHLESWLSMDWTDEVPHLQPWFGTGAYANAFGCEYLWRQGEAPDSHVRFHHIEEVRGITAPDWRKSPVMAMVLQEIDILKERTGGAIPIALTDTQSPCDTATLVLDTSELFTACYTEEETAAGLMDAVADLIIAFSRVQAERIGEGLVARPGHVMPSLTTLGGITLSDDNMAVSSPQVNEKFSLRFNRKVSQALGGVVLHSCGVWDHTLRKLRAPEVMGIDCSVAKVWDPTPMTPAAVGTALAGTGVFAKARCGGTPEAIREAVAGLARPGMRVILDIARLDEDDAAYRAAAERSYALACEELSRAFGV